MTELGKKPSLFWQYKREADWVVRTARMNAFAAWRDFYDWYESEGKQKFIDAFQYETGIALNPSSDNDARIGAALCRNPGDRQGKLSGSAFYRAHAEWFLIEMDSVRANVPREDSSSENSAKFLTVLTFIQLALSDSVQLFEDWGTGHANVPGAFNPFSKNEHTYLPNLYSGAKQTIYGHGTFKLSDSLSYPEIAIASIRQALEIRLRRGFGLVGKVSMRDGSLHPVALSELLEAIDAVREEILLPISFPNLTRIYSWANFIIHSGMRDYAWAAPRVLSYLREFFVGVDGTHSIYSGIRLRREHFDAIRAAVAASIETVVPPNSTSRFSILLSHADACEAEFV
jgi:hypothetical protein